MSVNYKLNRIHDNITHNPKPRYSISIKSSGNVNLSDLKENMSDMSSFTPGDVEGVIDNLVLLIKRNLKKGKTVTIDGLGTFFVTAHVVKEIEDPSFIPAGYVQLKGISFRPSTDFREDMKFTEFTRIRDKRKAE